MEAEKLIIPVKKRSTVFKGVFLPNTSFALLKDLYCIILLFQNLSIPRKTCVFEVNMVYYSQINASNSLGYSTF